MKCNTCSCPLPSSGTLCPCGKAAYCTPQCQKEHWKEHKPLCPPYKITNIPGRGRGLIATRKLAVGEVILVELPLMVIDREDSEVTSDVFREEFTQLDDKTKDTVLSLFDPVKDDLKYELLQNINEVEATVMKGKEEDPDNKDLSDLANRLSELGSGISKEVEEEEDPVIRGQRIFAANSMQVCEVSALYSATEGALYHHISLLNHSCNPNCAWSWTKEEFRRKAVRAVKPIKKGDEILANYVDIERFNYGSREVRRSILADKFGFYCKCSECSLEEKEFDLNEEQRTEVVSNIELIKELMAKFEGKSTVKALTLGTSTILIVKELDLMYEVPRLLLNLYQVATAARYQNTIGTPNPAIFAKKAEDLCKLFGDSFMHFYNFVCGPD